MDLESGTLVNENVRLVEPLGEGGMGSVWVADHLTLQTQVAVKFIAEELVETSPDAVKRFQREAAAGAQIKSPHVVQTLDHGVMDNGTPYIVMELLEGEDLGQYLDREDRASPEFMAHVLVQVGRALSKAHAIGIIHRDIKPDNIFLVASDDDEVFAKVFDFGIAKQTGLQRYSMVTATGTMVGTPAYMSPEGVLGGRDIDHRADLWSLGVVVYDGLCGDVPFDGETLGALCVAISRGTFRPPSEVRPELPPQVDAWMAKALALHPIDRFDSAKEMAEAFTRALKGDPVDDARRRNVATKVMTPQAPRQHDEQATLVHHESSTNDEAASSAWLESADTEAPGPIEQLDEPMQVGDVSDSRPRGRNVWYSAAALAVVLIVVAAVALFIDEQPAPADARSSVTAEATPSVSASSAEAPDATTVAAATPAPASASSIDTPAEATDDTPTNVAPTPAPTTTTGQSPPDEPPDPVADAPPPPPPPPPPPNGTEPDRYGF